MQEKLKSINDYYLDMKYEKSNAVTCSISKKLRELAKNDRCYIDIGWFGKYNRIKFYNVIDVHILSLSQRYEVILCMNDNSKRTLFIDKLSEMTYHEYLVNKIFSNKKN